MSAYLFPHFTNDDHKDLEAVWFAISRDGLNWTDLGTDEPLLESRLGTTGIRDPFVVYDEKLKKYFIIATDLCTTKGGDWYDFSHRGSRSLVVWESDDLISWSEERLVEVGIPEAGCVWAPEAVYCKDEDKWFVFFASCVKEKENEDYKQRIYGAFTSDFREFTPAMKYIDAETDVIDTNIIWDKGWYYRFSKDETNKFITMERCRSLIENDSDKYERVDSVFLSDFIGVEGPEAYELDDGRWCLIVDQYGSGKGYLPLVCDDLSTGDFKELPREEYNMGKRKKRHGSVIRIDDETADKLIAHYKISE